MDLTKIKWLKVGPITVQVRDDGTTHINAIKTRQTRSQKAWQSQGNGNKETF